MTVLVLGSQWELAGSLLCLLSFLGFGTVLKGLVNIVHINEEKAYRLLLQHIFSLFMIYPLAFAALFNFDLDISQFTLIFSLSTFVFWLIALLKTMQHFYPGIRRVFTSGMYIVVLTAIFCSSGLFLKSRIDLIWPFEMIVVGLAATALTLMLLYLVFPKIVRQQYIFIRDRLPRSRFW